MVDESDDQGPAWGADKRDFVADSRDDAADERDAVANARDDVADARQATADERESRFDAVVEQLPAAVSRSGLAPDVVAGEGGAARARADLERAGAEQEREAEDVSRDEARQRRFAGGRQTGLAVAFARIAEWLYAADSYDEVLTRIAEAAVVSVNGSESASVTVLEEGEYRTAASTDVTATAVDHEQYDADEGPSLDALTTPMVDAPAFPDKRWPVLGGRPLTHGVQAALAYHLDAHRVADAGDGTGSLNVYGLTPAAFDEAAKEMGMILAAHASLAARAVGERTTSETLGHQIQTALLARDVIGQAKGILMERLKVTPEAAFDILSNSSQELNLKLREVALRLTETGEAPDPS